MKILHKIIYFITALVFLGTFISCNSSDSGSDDTFSESPGETISGIENNNEDFESPVLNPMNNFLELDGTNDFGEITYHPSMFIDSEITIEALFYLNELPNGMDFPIISQSYEGSQAGNYLLYISDDGISFIYQPGSFFDNYYEPICSIEANKWYHVAVVFDYNDHLNTHIYLNGEEIVANWYYDHNTPINESPSPDSNGNFFVGYYTNESPYYFNGNIDELRIWNVLRSNEEIISNMQNELSGDESGLVSYWPFNESSENIVEDTCSDNDLVLIDGANIPGENAVVEDIDNDGDGFTENLGDCDDDAPEIYPGANEICDDGIDQDCNGSDLTCDDDSDDFSNSCVDISYITIGINSSAALVEIKNEDTGDTIASLGIQFVEGCVYAEEEGEPVLRGCWTNMEQDINGEITYLDISIDDTDFDDEDYNYPSDACSQ